MLKCTDVGYVRMYSMCTLLRPIPIELQHSAKIDGCCERQRTQYPTSVCSF